MKRLRYLALILCLTLSLPGAGTGENELTERERLDAMVEESYDAVVPEDGRTFYYYAQNDAIWNRMIFESEGSGWYRPFGDGACAPTSLAMCLRGLLDDAELTPLLTASRDGTPFRFCTCSVNPLHHKGQHEMATVDDLDTLCRYLPIVLGNYATGNNPEREKYRGSGRGVASGLFASIAACLSLPYQVSKDFSDMTQAVAAGAMVITLTLDSPLTTSSHYVVIADIIGDDAYILDPYLRADKEYPHASGVVFEQLSPGLLRLSLKQLDSVFHMRAFYILYPQGTELPDTP